MKKILLTLAITLGAFTIQAQTQVKKDSTGNYVTAGRQASFKATGKTFKDTKGIVYDVFQSDSGHLFVNRISKGGRAYKYYLKLK